MGRWEERERERGLAPLALPYVPLHVELGESKVVEDHEAVDVDEEHIRSDGTVEDSSFVEGTDAARHTRHHVLTDGVCHGDVVHERAQVGHGRLLVEHEQVLLILVPGERGCVCVCVREVVCVSGRGVVCV